MYTVGWGYVVSDQYIQSLWDLDENLMSVLRNLIITVTRKEKKRRKQNKKEKEKFKSNMTYVFFFF